MRIAPLSTVAAGRLSRALTPALWLSLALATTPVLAGQQQAPRFDSRVEMVQLQVQVVDEDGDFVPGLGPADFVLAVNGEERPVAAVYAVDLRRGADVPGGSVARVASSEPLPSAARRHFVLFFDLTYTSRQGLLRARRDALEFLDLQRHPDDLVAVATADRYGIRLLTPFSRDQERAREAVATLGLASVTDMVSDGGSFEDAVIEAIRELEGPARNIGSPSNIEKAIFQAQVGEAGDHVARLEAFGEMLKGVEGRKHVLLFSRGLDDKILTGRGLEELSRSSEDRLTDPKLMLYDTPGIDFGSGDIREALEGLIDTLREADAVVHAIDPTGLRASDIHDPSEQEGGAVSPGSAAETRRRSITDGRQTLMALADGTGGTANWADNDLGDPLARIAESTAAYYVVAYRKVADDPPTVDIDVRARVDGARVASAPTRLTPPPAYADMTPAQRQLQLAKILYEDTERRDIGFAADVVTYPGSDTAGRALVALEVPAWELDRLARARGSDHVQLELGAFAFRDGSGGDLQDLFRRQVRVDVAAMRARGGLAEQSFRYAEYLDLPEGDHRVRILLRELELGSVSGVTRRASVPTPATSPTLARPLLVTVADAAPPSDGSERPSVDPLTMAGRRLSPRADPAVSAGDQVLVLVVGYRLPRGTDGSLRPGLSLAVEAQGQRFGIRDFEILGVTQEEATDGVRILVHARLPASLPPGAARLRALLTEPTNGLQWHESTGMVVLSGPGGGSGAEGRATSAPENRLAPTRPAG